MYQKVVLPLLLIGNLCYFFASEASVVPYISKINARVENKVKEQSEKNKFQLRVYINSFNQVSLKNELKKLLSEYNELLGKEENLQKHYLESKLKLEKYFSEEELKILKSLDQEMIKALKLKSIKGRQRVSLMMEQSRNVSRRKMLELELLQLDQQLGNKNSYELKPLASLLVILKSKVGLKERIDHIKFAIKDVEMDLADEKKNKLFDSIILASERNVHSDVEERTLGFQIQIPLGKGGKDSFKKLELERQKREQALVDENTRNTLDIEREALLFDIRIFLEHDFSSFQLSPLERKMTDLEILKQKKDLYDRYVDYLFKTQFDGKYMSSLVRQDWKENDS